MWRVLRVRGKCGGVWHLSLGWRRWAEDSSSTIRSMEAVAGSLDEMDDEVRGCEGF